MNDPAATIASILEDLQVDVQTTSMVTIGVSGSVIPPGPAARSYDTISGPDDLPQSLRAEIGIVVAPLDFMSRTGAEQLLSRLRDVHCDRVLLLDRGSHWTPDSLRPLGFLELVCPSLDGRCYLYDPDLFSQPREWNNADDWANPENFRKYRW